MADNNPFQDLMPKTRSPKGKNPFGDLIPDREQVPPPRETQPDNLFSDLLPPTVFGMTGEDILRETEAQPDMDQAEAYARAYGMPAAGGNAMGPLRERRTPGAADVPRKPSPYGLGDPEENRFLRAGQRGLAAGWSTIRDADAVGLVKQIEALEAARGLIGKQDRTEAEDRRLAELFRTGGTLQAFSYPGARKDPDYLLREQKRLVRAFWRKAKKAAAASKDVGAYPASDAVRRMVEADSFSKAWDEFLKDPAGIIAELTIESVPRSVPGLAAGAVAGPAVGASVMGLSSFSSEALSGLRERLTKAGVNTDDPAALLRALRSPEGKEMLSDAGLAALPVAGLEGLAFGIAGKALSRGPIRNLVAQTGVQAAAGAGGEAGKQYVESGRLTAPGAVLAEAVAEAGGAPLEVATLRRGNPKRPKMSIRKRESLAGQAMTELNDVLTQLQSDGLDTEGAAQAAPGLHLNRGLKFVDTAPDMAAEAAMDPAQPERVELTDDDGATLRATVRRREDSNEAFVDHIEVREDQRRQGAARRFYQELEDTLAREGRVLVPSERLSRDGFAFWQNHDPFAVRRDLRFWSDEIEPALRERYGADAKVVFGDADDTVRVFRGREQVASLDRDALQEMGAVPDADFLDGAALDKILAENPDWTPRVVYRGSGRADRTAAYNTAVNPDGRPVLGDGEYYALTRDHAAEFGPDVKAVRAQDVAQNPLPVRSEEDYRALLDKAGGDPSRIPDVVAEAGHDGVLALWGERGDFDSVGRPVKRLRRDLAAPQLVSYRQAAPSSGGVTLRSGIDPTAVWQGYQAYRRTAERVMDVLGGWINSWPGSSWLSELGSLKQQDRYLVDRYLAMGLQSKIDKAVGNLFDAISDFSPSDKANLFAFLTGRVDPTVLREGTLREVGVTIKNTMNVLGEMLVDRGLLSEEAVAQYRGKYLPRMYLAHMFDMDGRGTGTGRKPDLSMLKRRKDIPEDVRAILGEIQDPGLLSSVGIGRTVRSLITMDLYHRIAQQPDWALQEGMVEIDGSRAGIGDHLRHLSELRDQLQARGEADLAAEVNERMEPFVDALQSGAEIERATLTQHKRYLRQLATRLQEGGANTLPMEGGGAGIDSADQIAQGIARAIDALQYVGPQRLGAFEADRRATQLEERANSSDPAIAEDMRALASELRRKAAAAALPDKPGQYKQVPSGRQYGALSGMWVHKSIYKDLLGSIDNFVVDGGTLNKIGRTWRKLFGLWKVVKVPANPPAVARNAMANTVLLNLSGVNMARVPDRLMQAIAEMSRGGPNVEIARRYGVGSANFAAAEMVRVQKDYARFASKNASPLLRLWWTTQRLAAVPSEAYGGLETIYKVAKIIDEKAKGATDEKAALEAHKWLFDYSLVPTWVKVLRNGPIPFITFSYKVVPRLAEAMVTRPLTMMSWLAFVNWALPAISASLMGVDEDDYRRLKNAMPRWVRDNPGAIILPWKDGQGRWQPVDLSYILPWGFLQRGAVELAEGRYMEAAGSAGILSVGPAQSALAAVLTNVDPFTKREIVHPDDPPGKQFRDGLAFSWNLLGPGFLTDYGAAMKILGHYTGEVDPRSGEPKMTEIQAWARLLGINIYPQRPEQSRAYEIRRLQRDIQDMRNRMRWRLRDRNLSPAERRRVRESFRDALRQRREVLNEYRRNSRIAPQLRTE